MQPLQICIVPTICIGRESWCLPYAGFYFIVLVLVLLFAHVQIFSVSHIYFYFKEYGEKASVNYLDVVASLVTDTPCKSSILLLNSPIYQALTIQCHIFSNQVKVFSLKKEINQTYNSWAIKTAVPPTTQIKRITFVCQEKWMIPLDFLHFIPTSHFSVLGLGDHPTSDMEIDVYFLVTQFEPK